MNAETVESQQAAGAGTGRYPGAVSSRAEANPPTDPRTKTEPMALMEAVLESSNLKRAYQRVVGNKGAASVDVMPTSDLKDHLIQHWVTLKERLLTGDYQPHPVRRVTIPKPQGGTRQLGIPTVQDRLIQQALHQVLSPMLEPHFSDSSYGFRPGRSAHDAVIAMQRHVEAGHRWVVDIDLAQFFDRVNHDVLMSLLARRIDDPRILKLIRSYLKAGVLEGGVTTARVEGTPQGGPLTPATIEQTLGYNGECASPGGVWHPGLWDVQL